MTCKPDATAQQAAQEVEGKLESIPGVGPSLARSLRDVGVEKTSDLRHRHPEAMYKDLCAFRGIQVDRCVLYVFRCAVYYAKHTQHDRELLKWWNWTDARVT